MAVNENVYGRRENWTTPNSPQNWSESNSVSSDFLEAYYPKIKTGCPQGQTDGRFSNLLAAGTISRDTTIDSSPAWVYTSLDAEAVGYMWSPATEFTFGNFYYEGRWVGDTYHNDLTPIMFQVYRHTGDVGNSFLKGMDGWYAPATNPDLVESVKRNQATERFSPSFYVSDEEMAEAIICADDTERFALTTAQVDPMYQTVYVQSTTNMYYVKNLNKLNSEDGYQFMYSINGFKGDNSSPIVSFCPKNFVLEINITYGTVVLSSNTSEQAVSRIVSRPSGLFGVETIPLGDFTEELVQQRLDDIYTFIHTYPETHSGADYPNSIYLIVFGMHCRVYNRSSGDTFTYTYSGDNSSSPIFNVLFNGGIRLNNMEEYEAPLVRYLYNQNYSGRWTYSTLPLYGDIGGGTSTTITTNANYSRSSNWENHPDFKWWSDNMSSIPVLLGVNLYQSYYERVGDSFSGYGYRVVPNVAHIWTTGDVSVIKDMAHERAAQYGLFFCDKYADIATKNTPSMWTDPDMMCGTFEEHDGIRITMGDYTNGMDNLNQPQFKMTDGISGETWNPNSTFNVNNGEYPQMLNWNLISMSQEPLPRNSIFNTDNSYPEFWYWNVVDIPVKPTPYCIFDTEEDYPKMPTWNKILIGAFALANNLKMTFIPNSAKSLGYNTYRKSSITEASIANDCTYYEFTFPDNCNVSGGRVIPLKRYNRYNSNVNEIASGTTLTTTIDCTIGDLVIATFTIRNNDYTISEGWTLLGVSDAIGNNNQITGMAYKIAENTTESFVITQGSSERIYCNLVSITGASIGTFSGFTTQTTGYSITTTKPNGLVLWGVSSVQWSTSSTPPKWSSNINGNSVSMIQLPATQPRLLTALDQSDSSTVTFTAGTTSTAYLACASLTITGISDFWYFD